MAEHDRGQILSPGSLRGTVYVRPVALAVGRVGVSE